MFDMLSSPAYMLPPLAAILVCIVLIIIVVSQGRRSTAQWLFVSVITSVGLWGLLIFGMRASSSLETATIWSRYASFPATATFILFYHFTAVYTREKRQKIPVIVSYLFLLAVTILIPTKLIIAGMRLEDYGFVPEHGPLAMIVSLITFIMLSASLFNLVKAFRSSTSYEERNRFRYLLIAIMFPVVGGLLDATTNLPPMLVWGQIIFVLICSHAIIRYHLLDIRLLFRKSVSYLIVSTFIGTAYGLFLYSLSNVVEYSAYTIWYAVLLILLLAIFLHPLQRWVQKYVDKLFYGERYSHLMALERLSRETQSILDIDELCRNFVVSLAGALRITRICLFLRNENNTGFELHYCSSDIDMQETIALQTGTAFIGNLETHRIPLKVKDIPLLTPLHPFTRGENEIVERLSIRLFVPIFFQGERLTGILALGEKTDRRDYSVEDVQLLSTITSQIALKLENARLYHSERSLRKALEKMNSQKSEFLHSVAHELKTPLTAIISSSELLDMERQPDEELRERLYENIRRSAHTINNKVTELLELAKTQIGDLNIETSACDIHDLLQDSASQLMIIFENKNQSLDIHIAEDLPEIVADKSKLQQVVFNLLSNASSNTPKEGSISITAGLREDSILVRVIDSGPTIPDEEKGVIFDPYYHLEQTGKDSSATGLGLGLAIARKFIELHNGILWVETEPAGGNAFSFTLPVK